MQKILILFFVLLFLEITSSSTNNNNQDKRNLKEIIEDQNDDEEDIIILHTNDVHCGLNDTIGYDGLMLYKRELQEKYKYILTVDTGDHIQGDTIGILSKGQDIINIMNEIEYDVVTIGNHEFDYGLEALYNCSISLNSGYISTNFCYRKNQSNIFTKHIIKEIANKKILFLGLTTPQTLTKTYLNKIFDDEDKLAYDFWAANGEEDFYKNVQNYINKITEENNVNYTIILSHLGNETSNPYSSSALISHIGNITAVIDGHSHENYNSTFKDIDGKDIPLVQAGTKLNYVGILKIKANGNITSELISEIPKPKNTTGAKRIKRYNRDDEDNKNNKDRWVDEEMMEYINNITETHTDELKQIIGTTNFNLIINIDKNKDNQISRGEESTLGDLITDAIRYVGEGDISMMSAGSIRTDLLNGTITYKNIIEILPYFNDIIKKNVSGQDILDAIEYGVRYLPQKSARFPQVSGISFKVDITFDSTVEVDENQMFVRVKGDRRVYDAKIGNKKIDPHKNYTISFDNYIGEGGDGYSMFRNKDTIETFKPDNEALISYIKEKLNGIIPDRYNSTQGRIIINSNNNDSKAFIITLVIIFIVIAIFFIVIIICVKVKKNNFLETTSIEMENVNNEIYQE